MKKERPTVPRADRLPDGYVSVRATIKRIAKSDFYLVRAFARSTGKLVFISRQRGPKDGWTVFNAINGMVHDTRRGGLVRLL